MLRLILSLELGPAPFAINHDFGTRQRMLGSFFAREFQTAERASNLVLWTDGFQMLFHELSLHHLPAKMTLHRARFAFFWMGGRQFFADHDLSAA